MHTTVVNQPFDEIIVDVAMYFTGITLSVIIPSLEDDVANEFF
jgi:hypothetical protein